MSEVPRAVYEPVFKSWIRTALVIPVLLLGLGATFIAGWLTQRDGWAFVSLMPPTIAVLIFFPWERARIAVVYVGITWALMLSSLLWVDSRTQGLRSWNGGEQLLVGAASLLGAVAGARAAGLIEAREASARVSSSSKEPEA